jgi:hypothetical protein
MKSLDNILGNIEELRSKLLRLIQVKEDLLDPEVVKASKLLDRALDEYYRTLAGRIGC